MVDFPDTNEPVAEATGPLAEREQVSGETRSGQTNQDHPLFPSRKTQADHPTQDAEQDGIKRDSLNSGGVLSAARSYLALGWQPTPLQPRSKAAMMSDFLNSFPDEAMYGDFFRDDRNVGIVFGEASGGLVDIDIDDPDALLIAGRFLPRTGTVFGRATAPDAHWLYRLPDGQEASLVKLNLKPGAIEIRSAKHQTMVPPSVHPNGERLAWSSFGEPAEVEWSELRRDVGWLAAATLLGRNWQSWPNQKHDISLALSGALLRSGIEAEEIKALLEAVCFVAGDPDVKDRLATVDSTVQKLEAGDVVTGWPTLRELLGKEIEGQLVSFIPAASKPGARLIPITDFWYVAAENRFHYRPTGELWQRSAVNASVQPVYVGTDAHGGAETEKATEWLGKNRRVESLTWWPGRSETIDDHVFTEGGLRFHSDATTLNTYRPPVVESGEATAAEPWVNHIKLLYPDESAEILNWLAYKVQNPGDKINHALVLGGHPGIGKDTILHPIRTAIGPWNMSEARPTQIMSEQFDSYQKAVILRVNEASDLGDGTRVAFGNHMKNIIADPPEVLSVNEKHRQRHYIPNLVGVVYTTNERLGALFLEERDRRHLCCWSDLTQSDFSEAYFESLYGWLESGGDKHVAAYLRERDLASFSPKDPPRKTEWFHVLVDSGRASEESGLGAVLEELGEPDAITITMIRDKAGEQAVDGKTVMPGEMLSEDVFKLLSDSRNNPKLKHLMYRAGYEKVNNPNAKSGMWRLAGKKSAVYAKRILTIREQIAAAERLIDNTIAPVRRLGEVRRVP